MAGAEELTAYGEERYRKGELEQALSAFLEATKILPSHARAHSNASVVYWKLGQREAALRHTEQALALSPRDPVIVLNGADIFRACDRQDKAVTLCQHYLREHGAEKQISDYLAQLTSSTPVSPAEEADSNATSYIEQEFHDAASLINYCIERFGYTKYLEIGCRDDDTFKQIRAPFKVGVDPVSGGTQRMTSDEFFRMSEESFDIVFVDGLHYCEQVYKDVRNALTRLRMNGTVVLHDCSPAEEIHQLREPKTYVWNGDVWKAFVLFRQDPSLDAMTANFDHGVGLLRKRPNSAPLGLTTPYRELRWQEFSANRANWLRLADAETIKRWL